EQVGGGVAVVFGADRNDAAPVKFRQAPDFFYLTGIEEPGLVLVMNGQTKQTLVFANPRSPNQIMLEGPGLLERADAKETYGIDQLLPMDQVNIVLWNQAATAQRLYLPLSLEDNLQQ
ncbi:MAG: hypothetical protein DMF88_11675, partial [Acidobacteria bacterium]